MCCCNQDIDKNNTEINRCKVLIVTADKMIKKLTKGIEEAKKEKDRFLAEKENLLSVFKEIEHRAFRVQDNYNKTQKVYLLYIEQLNITFNYVLPHV